MGAAPKARQNKTGRIVMIFAMIGLTVLVIGHFTDAEDLWKVLKKAHGLWIAAGVMAHVLYFVAYAFLYKLAFDVVGVKSKILELLPLMMASIFVRAVIPPGGASAAALFVDDAVQHGQSGGRAMIGIILVLLVDLLSLMPFLFWGIAALVSANVFKWYDMTGAAVFFSYIAFMIVMLALAHGYTWSVTRFLNFVRRVINWIAARFHKPDVIESDWPKNTAEEFSLASQAVARKPRNLGLLVLWGFGIHVINLAGLWSFVKAFGGIVPIGAVVAAFGMGVIFFVIGIIPEGVAIVETVMTLVFTSVGMSKATAIAVNIVFRGANFWLPLAIGMFTFGRIRRFGQRRQTGGVA